MHFNFPGVSWRDLFLCRRKGYRSFRRQQPEGETFLQVESDAGFGMTKITDGNVLAKIQFEITSTGAKHESAPDCRSPDDIPIYLPLDMLQNRVSFIAA